MQQETQPVARRSLCSCVVFVGKCWWWSFGVSFINPLLPWSVFYVQNEMPEKLFRYHAMLFYSFLLKWFVVSRSEDCFNQVSHCFVMEWVVVVFVILVPSTTKPFEVTVSIEIAGSHFIHHLSVWLGSVVKYNTEKLKKMAK